MTSLRSRFLSISHLTACQLGMLVLLGGVLLGGYRLNAQPDPSERTIDEDGVLTLEEFIIQERPPEEYGLGPQGRTAEGYFAGALRIEEIPRSVTLISQEAMRQYGLRDFSDLPDVGAGTARINYFGISGAPFLRGTNAGIYFNGMLRAFQLNEMPTSFGSLEELELVKGPAPAHLTPTLVGGFANFRPKQPYFRDSLTRVEFEVGAWQHYRGQVDQGQALVLFDRPAAYRVSVTGQLAGSYYDEVRNDFLSVYSSLKVRLTEDVTFFTGAEFYTFASGEVPGWNRPTQELIYDNRYVLGEPAELTSPAWGGTVVRTLTEFPYTLLVNPALHALAVPGDEARARIPADLRAHMIDLNDPAQRALLYALLPASEVPGFLLPDPSNPASVAAWQGLQAETAAALAEASQPAQDAFVYTPEYFAAGGEVLTVPLDGDSILSSDEDYADSRNALWFGDLIINRPDRVWTHQLFGEWVETEKLSTYGYAVETRQQVANWKLRVEEKQPPWRGALEYGAEVRFHEARTRQDFFAEPFSRRDLSRGTISPNSIVRAGPQRDSAGRNLWSPAIGANLRSQTYQGAVFATGSIEVGEHLTLHGNLRGEVFHWRTGLPSGIDRADAALQVSASRNGSDKVVGFAFQPVVHLSENLNLYAAVQLGTGVDPSTGGVIFDGGNFTSTELYELGLKGSFLNGRLFASVTAYAWDQARFNPRDARAEPIRGQGVEFEATWEVREGITLQGSFTALRTWLRADALGFGALPLTEEEWALRGGLLNAGGGRTVANNPELIYPGFPELSAGLLAVFELPYGFGISGGPRWQEAFWHNFDRTIRLPSALIWNANVFYRHGAWEVFLALENLSDEEYYASVDPVFAANTLVIQERPFRWRISVAYSF